MDSIFTTSRLCVASLYAHFSRFSFNGWRLAFVLLQYGCHLLVALSMALFTLVVVVFIVREIVACIVQLAQSCVAVGDACLGLATDSDVGKSVCHLTRMLSSGDLTQM